jgi:uncharacterized protein
VGLKEKLQDDLKQSLRAGKKSRVSIIRLVLSGINYAEMAKQAPLTESDVLGVIAKEARQHDESIDAFKKGNRSDLVAIEEAEMAVLKEYLPQQATRDEIVAAAKQVIDETGAKGATDKGKVMPKLMAQFKGKADGREINAIVSELLSSL